MTNRIRAFFENRIQLPSQHNGDDAADEDRDSEAPEEKSAGVAERSDVSDRNDVADRLDPDAQHRLHLAACALLLELAHADDEFTEAEATHIEVVLRRHFDLDEAEALEIMELAEEERSGAIDLWQFTNLIRSSYSLGQKTLLAEVMWGLILADGEIARHEAYLLRKIANLLDLEAGYLSAARKRVAGEE